MCFSKCAYLVLTLGVVSGTPFSIAFADISTEGEVLQVYVEQENPDIRDLAPKNCSARVQLAGTYEDKGKIRSHIFVKGNKLKSASFSVDSSIEGLESDLPEGSDGIAFTVDPREAFATIMMDSPLIGASTVQLDVSGASQGSGHFVNFTINGNLARPSTRIVGRNLIIRSRLSARSNVSIYADEESNENPYDFNYIDGTYIENPMKLGMVIKCKI